MEQVNMKLKVLLGKSLLPAKNNVPALKQEFPFRTQMKADYQNFKYRLKADRLKAVNTSPESRNP